MGHVIKVYVESNLPGSLAGRMPVETNHNETVGNVVHLFLYHAGDENSLPWVSIYDKNNKKLRWSDTLETQGIKDGALLYLKYNKTHFHNHVNIALAGFVTLIIAVVLLITSSVLFAVTGGYVPISYGIVIDAGSSHTAAYLYQWPGDKYKGTGKVVEKDSCKMPVSITSATDPTIIVSCVFNITKTHEGNIPLYLEGTGSTRLLNFIKPREVELIFLALKYALKTTVTTPKYVGLLQGKYEAALSWITSNVLMGNISPEMDEFHENLTFGALDLGGASTQYAYAINPRTTVNSTNIVDFKIYGREYFVMARSYNCFGVNEALYRYETLLITRLDNRTIYEPCLPKDFVKTIKAKDICDDPCMMTNDFHSCVIPYENMGEEFRFIGGSDYENCLNEVKILFNETACQETGFEMCLQASNISSESENFVAFSSFYHVTRFLNSTNVTYEEFIDKTKSWCGNSWEEIHQQMANQTIPDYVEYYCFGAVYIDLLLKSTYGFTPSTWKNIIFKQKVNNNNLGWALGFMMNETHELSKESPSPPMVNGTIFSILLTLSVVLMFTSAVLIYLSYKKHVLRKQEMEHVF